MGRAKVMVFTRAVSGAEVVTVAELDRRLRRAAEAATGSYWVEGEVTSTSKDALAPPIRTPAIAELPGRVMFGLAAGRLAGLAAGRLAGLAAGRAPPPGRPAGRFAT